MRTLPLRLAPFCSLLLSLALGACVEEKEAPPLALDDSGVDCNAIAPVITGVTVGNGGPQNFEGTDYFTFAVDATATDQDLDLDRFAADVWWDLVIDGVVDTSGTSDIDGKTSVTRDLPCGVATAEFIHYVPMKAGGDLPFDTQVEVSVIGSDAHNVESAPSAPVTGWTPNEDGTDGGT